MNFISLFGMLLLQEGGGGVGVSIDSLFSLLVWPFVIIAVIAAFFFIVKKGANRYHTVPQDKALVVYGRHPRIVTGGATLVLPIFDQSYYMDLSVFEVDLPLDNVPNLDRVPITIKAVALCRISSSVENLSKAAKAFGDMSQQDIKKKVQTALEGHLRIVIGQINMETVLSKRDEFNAKIQTEAATELEKLGCEIVILNIQDVKDAHGFIESLGKGKIAEALAEAKIKEADQNRRETIATSTAKREGETTRAENDAQIADAQRNLQIKQAKYNAEVASEKAKAEQAGPLATAVAQKAVVAAQVDVQESKVTAEIKLQDAVAKKTEAELKATVLKKAEAERQRLSIEAEGTKQANIITAEGEKQKQVIEAEGRATARMRTAEAEAMALEQEGLGQAKKTKAEGLADAEVKQKVGEAEAAAKKATLLAEADGQTAQAEAVKAKLLAEADGTRAMLLAQAEGMRELVGAYANLSDEQKEILKLKWVLEALPGAVEKMGEAGEKIMAQIAQTVTSSLGNIDNLTVYDSSGNGNGALGRVAEVGPNVLFKTMMALKETGMLPVVEQGLKNLGIDLSTFTNGHANGAAVEKVISAEVTKS